MSIFERRVNFSPAYDKTNADPKKNYGIGAVKITFLLGKDNKWVQFVIGTDWYPAHIQRKPNMHISVERRCGGYEPVAWDLGYHSPYPMYDGQRPTESCSVMDGCDCYYDGSALSAEPIRDALLEGGSDAVWERLEMQWKAVFSNTQPCEHRVQ